jgi:hypothetical protein
MYPKIAMLLSRRSLSLLLPLLLPLLLARGAAAGSNILVIGDSMGDYSCGNPDGLQGSSFLMDFCAGAKVTNVAVSGSTAVQWAEGEVHDPLVTEGMLRAGKGVTHIWMSLGGNDYMSPSENMPAAGSAPGSTEQPCAITTANLVTRCVRMNE